jgi:hypothetical protein
MKILEKYYCVIHPSLDQKEEKHHFALEMKMNVVLGHLCAHVLGSTGPTSRRDTNDA